MIRILRAFAWLRWRMLINSLEKTGARDTIERFSLAIEKLGPIMAGVLLIPSGLMLAGLGAAGGYALATGKQHSMFFEITRYLLLTVPILSIIGPLLLPAADRTNPVRMLLLPISRGTLYVAQSASALSDVWILLMLPLVGSIPLGLAAGGAFVAALVSLVAGITLVLIVVAISSATTSLLHLAVRDRRRGELLALLFILIIPIAGMLPHLIRGERPSRTGTAAARPARQRIAVPPWLAAAGDRAFSAYPSELYTTATRAAARREPLAAVAPIGALAATALLLHAIGMAVFARVLDSPGSTGARRSVPMRAAWGRTLPGLSPGASAVALAQLRLALRTPRGRSILLSPVMMLFIIGVFMRRSLNGMDLGPVTLQTGLGLGSFASFVCLMSVLPIAMNQFAVDKAGVTMALLSPLSDGDYLAGKAVGNGLIAAMPALFCLAACLAIFPGGSPALWLAIPVALLSTYFLVAPAAAVFSAMFPRVVDMNSIGRGSNAHGLSGLLGIVTFLVAGAPSLLIVTAISRWLGGPWLALLGLIVWCAITYVISRVLFVPARRIFASRRENLSML